jgi:glyoxylase-like metal-dependent hydrolase (beta-lactamase superfamily II)
MVRNVLITHGDADHSGSAGLIDAIVSMHPDTMDMIRRSNRAYGSGSEGSVLAEVYTKLINLFSGFSMAERPETYPTPGQGKRGTSRCWPPWTWPDEVEVLEVFWRHTTGQVFYSSCRMNWSCSPVSA